jgi:DNA-binding MarR family transcriptional regulator
MEPRIRATLCVSAALTAANISRICDSLVHRELITRGLSTRDRRRMDLRITAEGEELVERMLPTMFVSLRELRAKFSESSQRRLIAQLC